LTTQKFVPLRKANIPNQVQKIAQLTGHNAAIYALAPGRDEKHLLSAAGDGWVAEWNLEDPDTGRLVAKVDTQIFSLCSLPDENVLVVGNMNGGVHWVDLADEKDTRNVAHHSKGVYGICRVGQSIFTAGGDGKLTRWSVKERRSLESFHLANQSLRAVVYNENRNELAVGASDHAIYFLDAQTMELRHQIEKAHDNSVFVVRYSPDGKYLLSGGRDAHLKSWALEDDFELKHSLPAHLFTINDVVFHPQGHLFATASRDKTLKIWDAENFKLVKVLEGLRDGGHFNSVNRLFWSSHEETLISASDDRSLILWKPE
jgi:WD40 repeat protein